MPLNLNVNLPALSVSASLVSTHGKEIKATELNIFRCSLFSLSGPLSKRHSQPSAALRQLSGALQTEPLRMNNEHMNMFYWTAVFPPAAGASCSWRHASIPVGTRVGTSIGGIITSIPPAEAGPCSIAIRAQRH